MHPFSISARDPGLSRVSITPRAATAAAALSARRSGLLAPAQALPNVRGSSRMEGSPNQPAMFHDVSRSVTKTKAIKGLRGSAPSPAPPLPTQACPGRSAFSPSSPQHLGTRCCL